MAKLPVEIMDIREKCTKDMITAVDAANQIQDQFKFSFIDKLYIDEMWLHVRKETHTGQFMDALEEKKKEWRGFHPLIICFFDSAIRSDNWTNLFSSRRAKKGIVIVTTSNVEEIIVPKGKMASYFLFELAVNTLAFIVGGKKHHHEIDDDSANCVFGFKEHKKNILKSMKTGFICDDCRSWFLDNSDDLSTKQLSAFMNMLKKCSEWLQSDSESLLLSTDEKPILKQINDKTITVPIDALTPQEYLEHLQRENYGGNLPAFTVDVGDVLTANLLASLPEEHRQKLDRIAIGVLPTRSVNAWVMQVPSGGEVIGFDFGTMSFMLVLNKILLSRINLFGFEPILDFKTAADLSIKGVKRGQVYY